jgi:ParB-like chromosome segregation protein Spo0J
MNKKIPIEALKKNPDNPRIIKDDKFKKLIESVKSFPEMLELRPIVVNSEMMILGGNMRFAACKEAGLKEVPVVVADNLTDEQQKEFIIKDNASGGEWDWEVLSNEWDAVDLDAWGLDGVVMEIGNTAIDIEETKEPKSKADTEICPKCGFEWLK